MDSDLTKLRNFLAQIPAGRIAAEHQRELEDLLSSSWDELAIAGTGGMNPRKLFFRMENTSWDPPILHFEIERHGAAARGSVYAEIQYWSVDVEKGEASFEVGSERRVVGKKNPPLDVAPIAKRIYELIATATRHEWLQWNGITEVKILVGKVLPAEQTPQQTCRPDARDYGVQLKKSLANMGGKR